MGEGYRQGGGGIITCASKHIGQMKVSSLSGIGIRSGMWLCRQLGWNQLSQKSHPSMMEPSSARPREQLGRQ